MVRIARPALLVLLFFATIQLAASLFAQSIFRAARTFPAGSNGAVSIAVGDFNHDGNLDVVVADFSQSSSTVNVLLGKGNGNLGSAVKYSVSNSPVSVAVGDFNGDGHLDLAVLSAYGTTALSILLGDGDGTFQTPVQYAVGGSANVLTQALVVADFNGDHHLDIAVISAPSFNSNGVEVLLGKGDGTFQPGTFYKTSSSAIALSVGDFNGDGKLDIVATGRGSNATGSLLLGNGDGTFKSAVSISGANGSGVAVGDFNGDRKLDIAVADGVAPQIRVLFGNGDGTFQAPKSYSTGDTFGGGTATITAADLRNRGKFDLVVGNGDNTANVFLNQGNGTFATTLSYDAGFGPIGIATGDFNNDGRVDVVTANPGFPNLSSSVSVLLGKGDGTLVAARNVTAAGQVVAVAFADFNRDGHQDMATVSGSVLSTLLGNGDGTFGNPSKLSIGGTLSSVVSGDFNGDGIPDLAVVSQEGTLTVLLGQGNGRFKVFATYTVTGDVNGPMVVQADFNADGHLDLAVSASKTLQVLLGNGDGSFQPPVTYSFKTGGTTLVVGDFNNDKKLDIVTLGGGFNGEPSLLLGNGNGTFQAAQQISKLQPYASGAAAADFNGDGNLDLALDGYVLLGNGNGTFQAPITFNAGIGRSGLVAADFNGDGKPDLAVANDGSAYQDVGAVVVLLGKGDGTFQKGQTFASSFSPFNVAIADLDGDGKPDLVALDFLVGVFLNSKN